MNPMGPAWRKSEYCYVIYMNGLYWILFWLTEVIMMDLSARKPKQVIQGRWPISAMFPWNIYKMGNVVERRQSPDQLLTKGYEEAGSIRADSPTVCISIVRLLLRVAISTGCKVKKHISSLKEPKKPCAFKATPPVDVSDGQIWGFNQRRDLFEEAGLRAVFFISSFVLLNQGGSIV